MPHFPFRHKEDSHHPTGTLLATLSGHTATVRAIAWSPDSRLFASASDDGTLRIWNTESFQSIDILTGEEDEDGMMALTSHVSGTSPLAGNVRTNGNQHASARFTPSLVLPGRQMAVSSPLPAAT